MNKKILEETQEYAINKLTRQIEVVASAYLDGYNSAKGIVTYDDIEYIDLGLPSGTLWATKYIGATEESPFGIKMVYNDANRYKLPSYEQWKELSKCKRTCGESIITFTGLNGNKLILPLEHHHKRFWMANKIPDEDFRVDQICFDSKLGIYYSIGYVGDSNSVITVL